jgi:hypothetical protein
MRVKLYLLMLMYVHKCEVSEQKVMLQVFVSEKDETDWSPEVTGLRSEEVNGIYVALILG